MSKTTFDEVHCKRVVIAGWEVRPADGEVAARPVAAAVPDSDARTVAALRDAHNTLLAALRAAGMLGED